MKGKRFEAVSYIVESEKKTCQLFNVEKIQYYTVLILVSFAGAPNFEYIGSLDVEHYNFDTIIIS